LGRVAQFGIGASRDVDREFSSGRDGFSVAFVGKVVYEVGEEYEREELER